MNTTQYDADAYRAMTWQELHLWLARHRDETGCPSMGALAAARCEMIQAELDRRTAARRIWK